MQELKELIEDATTKVEQCEGLGNKLENEIIEWDAFKKLCRRDEELQEIESLVDEFKTDMDRENKQVLTGQLRQEEYIEKSQNSEKPDNAGIEDAKYLLEGIENFKKEIADLEKDVKELKDERDQCFGEFDADVPSSVKVDRNKRMAAALGKKRGSQAPTESDKPEDTYYKI
jgi:seryl-tRNA synthetase